MSKDILKNKLLKKLINNYNKDYEYKKTKRDLPINISILLHAYMQDKTNSIIVKRRERNNNKELILIKCTERKSECKYKKIKQLFSMNYDDIINKVPNAKEVEKELKGLILYLGLENKIEVTATYDKELYYSFRMTVAFLNEEQEKIKEKKSKLLKNVTGF